MSDMRGFMRAGHWPTLLGAFLYFDFSFMVWVMLGALGAFVAQDLGLTAAQKGLLVALPLLGGSAFRIVLGSMVDSVGPKKTGMIGLLLTAVPLFLAWKAPATYPIFLVVGLLLGIAGASFAAALPLAGRWYPPEHQGLALGLAGAGNSGTVLAAFFAPRLAEAFGWQAVFGLLLLPWALVVAALHFLAKEPPAAAGANKEGWKELLAEEGTWRYCGRYAVTFGGFVGLASFLPIFLNDQYGLPKVQGGTLTALCVLVGSFLRPAGGLLADRVGGGKVLAWVFALVGGLSFGLSLLLPLHLEITGLVLLLGTLGLGNGAIFQRVPQHFGPAKMGRITGLMGAMGGLGGFVLPALLGSIKQMTGSFALGFTAWGLAALAAWTYPAFKRAATERRLPSLLSEAEL